MTHVVKDFLTGSALLITGAILGLVGFILFFILALFVKAFCVISAIFFFVFLAFGTVWLVGFLFRKAREGRR